VPKASRRVPGVPTLAGATSADAAVAGTQGGPGEPACWRITGTTGSAPEQLHPRRLTWPHSPGIRHADLGLERPGSEVIATRSHPKVLPRCIARMRLSGSSVKLGLPAWMLIDEVVSWAVPFARAGSRFHARLRGHGRLPGHHDGPDRAGRLIRVGWETVGRIVAGYRLGRQVIDRDAARLHRGGVPRDRRWRCLAVSLADVLGFQATGWVDMTRLVLRLRVGCGVFMDYEVLLLPRMFRAGSPQWRCSCTPRSCGPCSSRRCCV